MMAGLVGIVMAAIAIGLAVNWPRDFSSQEIEDVIRSWGVWGVLGSLALMVLHSFVPFPAELIAVANGMAYGMFWGIVITWAGAMLGAVIAFNLINYAAGISRISWWTFIWTTAIGILPLTVLMVGMGDQVRVLPWWVWLALIAATAGLWYLFQRRLRPSKPPRHHQSGASR
ncbi:MAG TPA: VTT domain-containing protein [Woeseiaceae bacterium]|jgi:uncharacterized membrane protein YdjX (TVP38/TMEM64 family)|nr:VTT domain-containing protein [Woeseiaceae bacterium]